MSNQNGTFVEEETKECRSYNGILIAAFIYSLVVLVLYALLQRRANKFKEFLCGFLGIPVPVNLIHETKDRWVYAVAFGALTGDVLFLILDGNVLPSTGTGGQIWRGILLILTMMYFTLGYFALFASIHGVVQILSQIIGLVYVILVFIRLILHCSSCDDALDTTFAPGIFRNTQRASLYSYCIPTGICFVLIGAFFVWRGVQAAVYLIIGRPLPSQHTVNHHIGHVKRLLNNSPPTVPSNRLFAIIQPYVYQWDPYFKFSVRVISVGLVVVIALFLLTLQAINYLIILANLLEYVYNNFLNLDDHLTDALVGITYFIGVLIPSISFAIGVIGYISSLVTYRRQCKLLWKGDKSFLPVKKKPAARVLLTSIHFFGFQVAMVVWAWLIYTIVLLLILLVIIIIIVSMILFDLFREWILRQFLFLLASFITGYIIYYAQLYFVKFVFVSKSQGQGNKLFRMIRQKSKNVKDQSCSTGHKDKVRTAARGDIVLVNNRRLFHLFTFLFLFYYMIIGMFKAIRRVLVSAGLNLFYLSRLDVPLTVKGWEFLDRAYGSYVSLLKVDATYNNPVMNVFIYLVSQAAKARAAKDESYSSFAVSVIEKITVTDYYSRSLSVPLVVEQNSGAIISRAKKRWHLAYTLVRNPDLLKLRRRGDQVTEDGIQDIGHSNPAYADDGGESCIRVEKDDATKL